ncbi:HNH endonuclease [Streptomyces diastaticus]|uniref:HNH endonuclease n=1 Tax=Streptomyces diastaticus TaxID=1956 RepID=UPI0037BB8CD9
MPWSTSDRRSRLPKNWASLRRRVIRRDGGQCTALHSDGRRCELPGTDVDHIVPDSLGGSDDMSNLALCCAWHHRQKTGREGAAAAALTRVTSACPVEEHPALGD